MPAFVSSLPRFRLLIVVLAAQASLAGTAMAQAVFNFAEASAGTSGIVSPGILRSDLANSFTTGGDASVLSSVTLNLANNFSPGVLTVRLAADNAGAPGSVLETLSPIGPAPVADGLYPFTSVGTSLAANTTYWVTAA